MSPPTPRPPEKREERGSNGSSASTPTDISGKAWSLQLLDQGLIQRPEEWDLPVSKLPGPNDAQKAGPPFDTCLTEGCTAGLYHQESRQSGYCAKCRKDAE
jgi:hypothetical protein